MSVRETIGTPATVSVPLRPIMTEVRFEAIREVNAALQEHLVETPPRVRAALERLMQVLVDEDLDIRDQQTGRVRAPLPNPSAAETA